MTLRRLNSVSTRNLLRRKGRYALTASGIALGVAVLFAVQIMSGATNDALDRAITGAAGDYDVYIRPVGSFDATFPSAQLDTVRGLPDVELVGHSTNFRSALNKPGVKRDPDAFPDIAFVEGVDLAIDGKARDFALKDGRLFAEGANEIILGNHIAKRIGVKVGDTVNIAAPSGSQAVPVVGILNAEGAGNSNSGDIAFTTIANA